MANDNSMGKYILSLLNEQKMVFWSWGPSQVVALPNGLRFHVQGFKFTGIVRVAYNSMSDLFDITFKSDKGGYDHEEQDVFFDQLVEVIDDYVERTDDYETRVTDWLNENGSED